MVGRARTPRRKVADIKAGEATVRTLIDAGEKIVRPQDVCRLLIQHLVRADALPGVHLRRELFQQAALDVRVSDQRPRVDDHTAADKEDEQENEAPGLVRL